MGRKEVEEEVIVIGRREKASRKGERDKGGVMKKRQEERSGGKRELGEHTHGSSSGKELGGVGNREGLLKPTDIVT